MIAGFPMYDRPETAAAHDRLWALVRTRLGYGPARLTRAHDKDLWRLWEHPELLCGVACGLPLRARLKDRVTLVGSLVNDLPGCPPGHYFSRFVIPAEATPRPLADYAGLRFAYNQAHSQSGWAAAQTHAAELGFRFQNVLKTGAHRDSARALAEGRADIACIDAVSWALICEYDDFAEGVQVIGDTKPTPGEPVLTALGGKHGAQATRVHTLARALADAIAALSPQDRATLHLAGFADAEEVPLGAYLAVPTPPAPHAPDASLAFAVASHRVLRPTPVNPDPQRR